MLKMCVSSFSFSVWIQLNQFSVYSCRWGYNFLTIILLFLLFQELWAISAPRPGINSSSEGGPPVKGSRINPKNSATCLWEENPSPRGPRKHGESIQTAFRKRLLGPIPPPCPEVILHPPSYKMQIQDSQYAFSRSTTLSSIFANLHLEFMRVQALFFFVFLIAEACPEKSCQASQHKAVSCEEAVGSLGVGL